MILPALWITLVFCLAAIFGEESCNPSILKHPSLYMRRYKDKCYLLTTTYQRVSSKASETCRLYGGSLAMPKTKDENDFLKGMMKAKNVDRAWIGLNDAKMEKVFEWEDGTRLNVEYGKTMFPAKEGYKHWLVLIEDCVALDVSGTWHDYTCTTYKNRMLCQFDVATTTTSTTTTTTPAPTTTTAATTTDEDDCEDEL